GRGLPPPEVEHRLAEVEAEDARRTGLGRRDRIASAAAPRIEEGPPGERVERLEGLLETDAHLLAESRVDEARERAFPRVVVDVVEIGGVPFEEGARAAVGGGRGRHVGGRLSPLPAGANENKRAAGAYGTTTVKPRSSTENALDEPSKRSVTT